METQTLLNGVCTMLLLTAISVWAETAKTSTGKMEPEPITYPIVDTGQIRCYNAATEIEYPKSGTIFFGQDAHYNGNQPSYKDNEDGTVTDLVTGLMWTQDPAGKMTHSEAVAGASKCKVGGHSDWRLPTIKELYSLILFSGTDPDPMSSNSSSERPFIDTTCFKFQYGDPKDGDRVIDSQFATSTIYRSTTMNGQKTMFGVNFADGRIKGYPIGDKAQMPGRGEKTYYVLYVRKNTDYGKNKFVDNGDGTITDKATGLIWMKVDSGALRKSRKGAMNWGQALKWAEDLEYADHSDWRLPTAKELQSIVDYTRCPDVTDSAAIDPMFEVTAIKNEGGQTDYPCYWSSTSHCKQNEANSAVYISFGRGLGFMQDRRTGRKELMDVHGAGSQRSDPKSGNPAEMATGRGPQGDVVRIYNHVRCVRGGTAAPRTTGPAVEMKESSRRQRPERGGQQGGQMGRNRQDGQQMGRRGQQGGGQSGAAFVQRLDKDGDNRVSKAEFDGPDEHFSQLDANNDGYLTEDEAPQGPPQGRDPRGGGRR